MEKTARLLQLENLLSENPKDSFVRFAIAKEYESMDHSDLACEQYVQLLKSDPDYVGAYYHLGKLYEELGQETEALQTYETGIRKAESQGDQHSKRELAEAKLNLSIS
jgi:tetratricopeptide (TPR) repeat protein